MQKLPLHIAIVMDGNGRWAESRQLPRMEGHRAGIETVKRVVQHCLKMNISTLSLFAFSLENWQRPEKEVTFLMQLFIQALEQEIETLNEHGVCLRFIGNREALSSKLQEQMCFAETLTRSNDRLNLNIAVNYSGKWDILQAAKRYASDMMSGKLVDKELDESYFARYLSNPELSEPDLFIRTSGEHRISNFFLWQLAYTELYFTNIHWPDFTEDELDKALASFNLRERRYGRV